MDRNASVEAALIRLKGLGILTSSMGLEDLLPYDGYFRERNAESISVFEVSPHDKMDRVREAMETTPYALTFAFPYLHGPFEGLGKGFSLYTRGRDYHEVVRELLQGVISSLTDAGYKAELNVDCTYLPERLMAYISGIGVPGRNGLIYTEGYGSFVFLAEILTDYSPGMHRDNLPESESDMTFRNPTSASPALMEECRDCRICIDACPGKVLGGDYQKVQRCLSQITQMKGMPFGDLEVLKGRIFGCDTCQTVCPVNRRVLEELKEKSGALKDFEPFQQTIHPDLMELAIMDKKVFLEKYSMISAAWRGKTLLQRNALAALYQEGITIDSERINAKELRNSYEEYLKILATR